MLMMSKARTDCNTVNTNLVDQSSIATGMSQANITGITVPIITMRNFRNAALEPVSMSGVSGFRTWLAKERA